MKTMFFLSGAASALLLGSAAVAQPASPPSQAPSAPAAASGTTAQSFTDDQLRAFVRIALEMRRTPGATQDQAAMAAAVEKGGLTIEQYNQIANRMRGDQAFNARIQELAKSSATQSGPAESSAPSQSGAAAPSANGGGPSAQGAK